MEIITEIILKNSTSEKVKRVSGSIETDIPNQVVVMPGALIPVIASDGCPGYGKVTKCSIGLQSTTIEWSLVKADSTICESAYKIYQMRTGQSVTGSYQSRSDGRYSLKDSDRNRNSFGIPKSVRDFLDD